MFLVHPLALRILAQNIPYKFINLYLVPAAYQKLFQVLYIYYFILFLQ